NRFFTHLCRQNLCAQWGRTQTTRTQSSKHKEIVINRRAYRLIFLLRQRRKFHECCLIIGNITYDWQMIAGGTTLTAARLFITDINLFCPLYLRETINQLLAILLLIVLTERRIFAAAMIT